MITHNIPFSVLKRLNYPKSAAMSLFSYGLKNEFETAVVNEPSVFEPLKFYCIYIRTGELKIMISCWHSLQKYLKRRTSRFNKDLQVLDRTRFVRLYGEIINEFSNLDYRPYR